jgi:hypothetical protein
MRKKKRRKRDFLPVEFAFTVVSLRRRVLEMADTHIRLSPRFLGCMNQSSPKEKNKKEEVIKYNRGSHLTEKVI